MTISFIILFMKNLLAFVVSLIDIVTCKEAELFSFKLIFFV